MFLKESEYRRRKSRWPWVFAVLVLAGACAALVVWHADIMALVGKDGGQGRATASRLAELREMGDMDAGEGSAARRDAVALPDPQGMLAVAMDVVRMARELEEQGNLLEACETLVGGLDSFPRDTRIEEALGRINVALLTTPRAMPGKVEYVIKSGDSLAKIASEFVCPVLLIQKINNIANPDRIRPGDVLRVMDRPKFAIEVSKRDNTLLVTLDGKFFKRYSVGTGEYGKTPVGTFIIREKIESPPWWRSDGKVIPFGEKENILGTRWMEIEATAGTTPVSGYGIHGTWENDSIGKQSSAGCIRMRNEDVEEIYMMVPRGTAVTIVE